ncbi:hypothetical protein FB45DRAFT_1037619 [Roridomyces roridus]|uniref:Uncharacterized protein n=1 Tax=Roridomyces roridus TaxID=1738132 RepID=A0AAD7FC53_9AGAR|nr:hypothetical protein FB45DRAFT_1037619 [Roridomyces roridus]
MPSFRTRRTTIIDNQQNKTPYDIWLDELNDSGNASLAKHACGKIFTAADPDQKGNVRFKKLDKTPFRATLIAEVGSEADGTHLSALPKQLPPSFKLPLDDFNAMKGNRMSFGLRRPTGAPADLCKAFRNAAFACDSVRNADLVEEEKNGQVFNAFESVNVKPGEDGEDDITIVLKLHPTFELPASAASTPATPRSRRRITRAPSPTDEEPPKDSVADAEGDVDMDGCRTVGDKYPATVFPEIRDASSKIWKATNKVVAPQREYKDIDGSLIAPHELRNKFTEGTLVLVIVELVTYVIKDQGKKIYHVLADKVKILDYGNGEPWVVASPEERSVPSPAKRPRDEALDTAFDNFGAKASPSKKSKKRSN